MLVLLKPVKHGSTFLVERSIPFNMLNVVECNRDEFYSGPGCSEAD